MMRWLLAPSMLGLVIGASTSCDESIPATLLDKSISDAGAPISDAPSDAAADVANSGGVAFKACPGAYSGACAELLVPLDWSKPDGKKIPLYVDKITTSSSAKGQLWLLQGGPGGSGADMVPVALQIAAARNDLDIFTLDHRGVGRSARLGCASEDAPPPPDGGIDASADASDAASDAGPGDAGVSASEALLAHWEPCMDALSAEWGDGLAQFNTTNAARDLAFAIEQTKKPGQAVYVYGASYGTYWAHRYLQVFPQGATGVILDSIVPADNEFFSMFDFHFDGVGQRLAELCKADATCSAHLGADPWAKLQSIVAKIGTGHCPDFPITREQRGGLTQLLTQRDTSTLALAALYRYDRCNAEDVAALKALAARLRGGLGRPSALFSQSLYFNVAYSELWESPPPSLSTLEARSAAAVFPAGADEQFALQARWPKYPKDSFVRQYATTSVPMLMLNGTLDGQTPIETASLLKTKFTAPHQTFVTIPNANHGVIFQSPVKTQGAPPCGFSLIMSFLNDPNGTVDQSCLADLAPLNFETSPLSTTFFGTPDIWVGAPTSPVPHDDGSLLGGLRPGYPYYR